LEFSWSPLFRLIALAGALLCGTLPSFAYCFQPDPTVACEFLNSDAVFIGTVTSAQGVPPRGAKDLDGWLYSLSVQKLFRGPQTRTIEVFTENSSGRFPLDVGKDYLLFAHEEDGRLTITNCGNSGPLSKAQKAIQELRGLEIPQDAVIEGRISFSHTSDWGTRMPTIQLIVRGDRKTFKATTDREGWFHVHVSPGNYLAEARQIPDWNVAPSANSYDNPNHFEARRGRCSQLQFVANSK
jgi:hypothetical protein